MQMKTPLEGGVFVFLLKLPYYAVGAGISARIFFIACASI